MSSDLAILRAAGFDIISSKFVTQLQEQVAELQQRNAELQRQNTNLTRTLNEELVHQVCQSDGNLCCFSDAGCRSSSPSGAHGRR